MTLAAIITTFSGAFVFGFIGRWSWPKLCDEFGAVGGILSAGFLVGTFWIGNHWTGLIVQTEGSSVWVDQGLAIGCAFLFADAVNKKLNKASFLGVVTAIAGGSLAGLVLSL